MRSQLEGSSLEEPIVKSQVLRGILEESKFLKMCRKFSSLVRLEEWRFCRLGSEAGSKLVAGNRPGNGGVGDWETEVLETGQRRCRRLGGGQGDCSCRWFTGKFNKDHKVAVYIDKSQTILWGIRAEQHSQPAPKSTCDVVRLGRFKCAPRAVCLWTG